MAEVTDLLLLPFPESDDRYDPYHLETLDPTPYFVSAAPDDFDSFDLAQFRRRISSDLVQFDHDSLSDSGSEYPDDAASFSLDLLDHSFPPPHFTLDEVGPDDLDLDLGFTSQPALDDSAAAASSDWGAEEFFLGRIDREVDFDSSSDTDPQIAPVRSDVDTGETADGAGIPLCWDCLCIDDERRDEFEWEEVEDAVADDAADGLREMARQHDEDAARNVDWEILMSANNLSRSPDVEAFFPDDGFVYTSEYEIVVGLPDHDSFPKGTPPAAKSVVDNLPSVVLTEEDMEKGNTTCAVCKSEVSVGEQVKKLPCCHYYHGECILPWLGMRNTCPLCRFELLTDDAEYESLKARRARDEVSAEEDQARYDFEILHGVQEL